MPELMTNEAVKLDGSSVEAIDSLVARVCARVAPLWDLPNYVAVNPFLGFTSRPLAEAARAVADSIGARVLPPVEFYRRRWREGGFGSTALDAAATRHGLDPAALEAVLDGTRAAPVRPDGSVLSLAEKVDRAQGTRWHDALVRSTARWCGVYASDGVGGGGAWGPVAAGQGLFASWREAESVDRTLEIAGLKGWRTWVRRLPASAAEATALMLAKLDLPAAEREAYLYHLLGGLLGWASYFRRPAWAAGDTAGGDVADLLAIRLCADVAVHELAPRSKPAARPKPSPAVEDEATRVALQDALEDGYVAGLLEALNPPPAHKPARPAVQAVFCIDVRSEPLRRHLEAQSPAVETLGFAGFFGVSLDWQAGGEASARCPVLLKPAVRLRATGGAPKSAGPVALKHLQAAPAGAFSVVETLGALYGVGLLRDAAVAGTADNPAGGAEAFALDPDGSGAGLDLARRTDLAAGILKNTGLRFPLGRLVLLCGHEGRSANNPHVAGLHCGACGGHGGAINARVAAAVLNDPAVRDGLRARGVDVPADTRFVAGVHDTSVDRVTLFDLAGVPSTHAGDVETLKAWLAAAGEATRAERAANLGLAAVPAGALEAVLDRRARDPSEVRPEWGLARNAAFVAARRARTRGVDLDGRTFLHEYDAAADPDSAVLTLILTAPVVVASWINLQYLASTVDNDAFGCGDKALHNRVGSLGVVLGNGGDLRTGLALQSVHAADGTWFHEPLRLQVVVEAAPEKIEAVLRAQPGVRELVENGWIRLFAIDPDGDGRWRRVPGEGWEPCAAGAGDGVEPAAGERLLEACA